MNPVRALRERRNAVARNLRNLIDNTPATAWKAEQQARYDRDIAELDDLDEKITNAIALVERRKARDIVDTPFDRFARRGYDALSQEEQDRFVNTMSTTTGSQGGFTVSGDVSDRWVDTLKDFSGVRQIAEVIATDTGDALPWPTSDGTSETGELLTENTTATAADPSFGSVPLSTYKYSSKIFTVPFELLRDSGIDLTQFLLDRAAARIGRISNTHFTTGTGSGQPQGFATAATLGKTGTTGQTTTVIHDDLVDLIHSVNTAYRQDPRGGVAFQMADVTFKVVRKLKDTAGRPIYLPSDGVTPECVLGYPVIVNDDCAVPAANAKSIFFGNFRQGYKVRDALALTMFRMDDSGYITKGQVGFLAFARCGGALVDTAAVKYYAHSAT